MSVITADRIIVNRRHAGSPVRVRTTRRQGDRRRPWTQAWHPGSPGGRPVQPSTPISALGNPSAMLASQTRLRTQASQEATGQWHLTERGLAVIMAGFTLALLLGAYVVIAQYLALVP